MIDPASTPAVRSALLAHLRAQYPELRYEQPPERIFGGNQSFVYGLTLVGAEALCGPLILRILRPFLPAESVTREAVIQGVLRDHGYPVARVGYACSDPKVLGGAFQLMERLPGAPLLAADSNTEGTIGLRDSLRDARSFTLGDWPEKLAALHHRLHTIPVPTFLSSCADAGLERAAIDFDASLGRLEARVAQESLLELSKAFAWLRERRGFGPERSVLCHGDFFPNQVMAQRDEVSGVIDWSDFCLAPPELDVATLRVGIETLPLPLGALGRRLQRRRARHFFDAYSRLCEREGRSLDADALVYAEAFRCSHSLLGVRERRRALHDTATPNPNPYDAPRAVADLSARLRAITGIEVPPEKLA